MTEIVFFSFFFKKKSSKVLLLRALHNFSMFFFNIIACLPENMQHLLFFKTEPPLALASMHISKHERRFLISIFFLAMATLYTKVAFGCQFKDLKGYYFVYEKNFEIFCYFCCTFIVVFIFHRQQQQQQTNKCKREHNEFV